MFDKIINLDDLEVYKVFEEESSRGNVVHIYANVIANQVCPMCNNENSIVNKKGEVEFVDVPFGTKMIKWHVGITYRKCKVCGSNFSVRGKSLLKRNHVTLRLAEYIIMLGDLQGLSIIPKITPISDRTARNIYHEIKNELTLELRKRKPETIIFKRVFIKKRYLYIIADNKDFSIFYVLGETPDVKALSNDFPIEPSRIVYDGLVDTKQLCEQTYPGAQLSISPNQIHVMIESIIDYAVDIMKKKYGRKIIKNNNIFSNWKDCKEKTIPNFILGEECSDIDREKVDSLVLCLNQFQKLLWNGNANKNSCILLIERMEKLFPSKKVTFYLGIISSMKTKINDIVECRYKDVFSLTAEKERNFEKSLFQLEGCKSYSRVLELLLGTHEYPFREPLNLHSHKGAGWPDEYSYFEGALLCSPIDSVVNMFLDKLTDNYKEDLIYALQFLKRDEKEIYNYIVTNEMFYDKLFTLYDKNQKNNINNN